MSSGACSAYILIYHIALQGDPAMKEEVFNVFAYGDEESVYSLGCLSYLAEGSFEDLVTFLRSRVHSDYGLANRIPLDSPITWQDFNSRCRLGWLNELENGLVVIPEDSVYCITPIVNDLVTVDEFVDFLAEPEFPDYLKVYLTEAGFDIPRLIDDDFIEGIRLLMNERRYVSALKLTLSMIDTLGFIEFGPKRDCFVRWLDKYCAMEDLGVTSKELWELRNSILHMTNLDSRRVVRGEENRLLPAFAALETDIPDDIEGYRGLHVYRLILRVVPEGIKKWLSSYNENRDKFVEFVTQYDSIVSDVRYFGQHPTE